MNDAIRRKFFEDFAREQGFDPLIASNWYRVKTESVDSRKVCERTIKKEISSALYLYATYITFRDRTEFSNHTTASSIRH